jgi:hypothetical protein
MSLIKLNEYEASLYRAWIRHFEQRGEVTYRERTQAYFNATKGIWPSYV